MKTVFFISVLLLGFACSRNKSVTIVSTATLLDEMTDLERIVRIPDQGYRTVQYSSYDRRSTKSTDSCWFSNEDGFGNEPIPGFEKVIKQPDSSGIGEYLVCDIKNPGAILRLWTAGIQGKIRMFIDNDKKPVYEGPAEYFFRNTPDALSADTSGINYENSFRQFDAVYFPVPFAERCRIEWIGDIKEIHFYHVGVRIYEPGTIVESFTKNVLLINDQKIKDVKKILENPDKNLIFRTEAISTIEVSIPSDSVKEIFNFIGEQAIEYFSIKIEAEDMENVLRKTILTMFFDDSSVPQVQSPLGDFFGAAPGINPYNSLPFSVESDGTMICRFIMPFKNNARIKIENFSGGRINISGGIRTYSYRWEEGKSMHFRSRWRIDHGLTASNININASISDILYLMTSGKGRLVGVAAYLYNPSNSVTSWGNWWGEGDEKIYVDQDTFPSFFGTGSEDYFNYSWSSARLFSYPYCGQPRNDGPGNRGYVSNYRWHISDDIPFNDKLAFFMELGNHGIVPNFSYGRIAYFYALPGLIDDFQKISMPDLQDIQYQTWKPIAYCGSAGFSFIQAEKILAVKSPGITIEKGNLWAEDDILMWKPVKEGESIRFSLNSDFNLENTRIGLTLSRCPDGGKVSIRVNGIPVKFSGKDTLELVEPDHQVLENYFSESIPIHKGKNEILFENGSKKAGRKIGIDFFWIKDN